MKSYLVAGGDSVSGNTSLVTIGASMKLFLSHPSGDGPAMAVAGKMQPIRPLRLLLSYHYYKDVDLDELMRLCFEGTKVDIFADSGAFSAWSIGQTVVAADYIAWVKKWQHHFSAVAGPDVIGDPVTTQRETVAMISAVKGVPVLPVFHVGEDWSFLDYWVGKTDYLALGGMVPYVRQKPLLIAWLNKAFSRIPETMNIHGFGMTSWGLLLKYPWYSVDSSSWTSGFRYAQLQLFDPARGKLCQVVMSDNLSLMKFSKLLSFYGLRVTQVQAKDYDRDLLCAVSVRSWQEAEAWLTQRKAKTARSA
jgi:hypothetical protein